MLLSFVALLAAAVTVESAYLDLKSQWGVCTYDGVQSLDVNGQTPKLPSSADTFTNSNGYSAAYVCRVVSVTRNGASVSKWMPHTEYEIKVETNMPQQTIGAQERGKNASDSCTYITTGASGATDSVHSETRTIVTGQASNNDFVVGITCRHTTTVLYNTIDLSPPDRVYDYVVVGSGPGGLAAAQILGAASKSVAVLERGPDIDETFYKDKMPFFTSAFCPSSVSACAPGNQIVDATYKMMPTDTAHQNALTYSRWGGQQTFNGAVYAPAKADNDVATCAALAIKWHVPEFAQKYSTHFDGHSVARGVMAVCDSKNDNECYYGDMPGGQAGKIRRRTVSRRIAEMETAPVFESHKNVNVASIDVKDANVVGVSDDAGNAWHIAEGGKVVLAAGALGTARLVCNARKAGHNITTDGDLGLMHNHFYINAYGAATNQRLWFETFEINVAGSNCASQQIFEMQLAGNHVNEVTFVVLMQMQPATRFMVSCAGALPHLEPTGYTECDISARATAIAMANTLLQGRMHNSIKNSSDNTVMWSNPEWAQAYHWGGGLAGTTLTGGVMAADASMVADPQDAHMSMQATASGIRAATNELGGAGMTQEELEQKCGAAGFRCANMCCKAMTAECLACAQCTTPQLFCRDPMNNNVRGCKDVARGEEQRWNTMAAEKGIDYATIDAANASGFGGLDFDAWEAVDQGSGLEIDFDDSVNITGAGDDVLVLAADKSSASGYQAKMNAYIGEINVPADSDIVIVEGTYHSQYSDISVWYSDDVAQSAVDTLAHISTALEFAARDHMHVVVEGVAACAWLQAAVQLGEAYTGTHHLIDPECPVDVNILTVYNNVETAITQGRLIKPVIYRRKCSIKTGIEANTLVAMFMVKMYGIKIIEQSAACSHSGGIMQLQRSDGATTVARSETHDTIILVSIISGSVLFVACVGAAMYRSNEAVSSVSSAAPPLQKQRVFAVNM